MTISCSDHGSAILGNAQHVDSAFEYSTAYVTGACLLATSFAFGDLLPDCIWRSPYYTIANDGKQFYLRTGLLFRYGSIARTYPNGNENEFSYLEYK